ncbi:AAA family ATPase [Mycobacterium sp. NPDC050551]|uniref:AAA family ATPase n=1 Tax=Mycobacterium sp. NPDC050551 TaxID=3155407 RepID=UPI0034290E6B
MGKHRTAVQRSSKIAAIGAVTATATALTVGVGEAPKAHAAAVSQDAYDLTAGVHIFPAPEAIPDVTGGLGTGAYNASQAFADIVLRAIVENVNLAALAEAAGVDPETLATALLNNALGGVLGSAGLGGLGLDLGELIAGDSTLGTLLAVVNNVLPGELDLSIGQLLGLDPSQPLDLSEFGNTLGLNLVTSGGPFTLLKLLGVDLGWTPPLPNSIADEINGTDYLSLSLTDILSDLGLSTALVGTIDAAIKVLNLTRPEGEKIPIIGELPSIVALRVPVVAGYGLGAFAAGAAYQQVVDALPQQPGGADAETDPLLGSFTILPMLLIDNPGRANGGILARAYPLFRLLGIDTVTPDTNIQSSADPDDPLDITIPLTGLTLGGANLIPIKLDVTAEYLPMSDFAAWPNPFTMANNVAAGLFPTYILRDQSLGGIVGDLTSQVVTQLTADLLGFEYDPENPTQGPGLNVYYTLDAQSLPLLEPTYLAVDVINLLTGANLNNPVGTALNPVLTNLVNLGYTDVERVWNPDGYWEYERSFDEADIPTAFGTLPADVDWAKVPEDVVTSFVYGVQKAIDDGLVKTDAPASNALAAVLGLLGLGDLTSGVTGLDAGTLTSQIQDALDKLPTAQDTRADENDLTLVSKVPDLEQPTTFGIAVEQEEGTEPAPGENLKPVTVEEEKGVKVTGDARDELTDADGDEESPKTTRPRPLRDAANAAGKAVKDTVNAVDRTAKKVEAGVKKALGADKKAKQTSGTSDKDAGKTDDKDSKDSKDAKAAS